MGGEGFDQLVGKWEGNGRWKRVDGSGKWKRGEWEMRRGRDGGVR
jgi:hypothetical protein